MKANKPETNLSVDINGNLYFLVVRYHHTIIRAAFVCLFVHLLLRGPLTDLRQTWWVYVGGPRNCP